MLIFATDCILKQQIMAAAAASYPFLALHVAK
jgi:hypothetical protein